MNNICSDTIKSIVVVLVCSLVFGCKKIDNSQETTTNAVLQFTVSGIKEDLPDANASLYSKNESPINNFQYKEYDDISTLSYFETEDNRKSNAKNLMASTKMSPGIKYRVELFEVNGGGEKHWRTLNLTSNASVTLTDTIGVVHGKTYKWYAYSYNTQDNITVPAKSLDISMGINKDFLFASNQLTISQYGNTPISILFQRKTARLAVDIDTRGANAHNISNLQVVFPSGIIKTGNFNLRNQTVSAVTNVNAETLTLNTSGFVNVSGGYRKVAYLHSVEAISRPGDNSLSITVPTITYTVSNGLAGTTNNVTSTKTSLPFSFSNVTVGIGASGSLKADLLAKGITYNTVEWAPANLYRHDTVSTHRYRFYPHNNQTTDYRTLFSFRGYVPLQLATRTATPIDACSLVYPYKRWKTPSNSDFSKASMVTSSGLVGNILDLLVQILLGGNVSNSYAEFNSTLPNNRMGYGSPGGLVFPLNGYLPSFSLVNFPTSLDDAQPLLSLSLFETFESGGILYNSGHLWTFDPTIDLGLGGVINVATVGAQHYLALTYPARVVLLVPVSEDRKAVTTTDLLNISLLNNTLGIISSSFKNVRCIRDSNYENIIKSPSYKPEVQYDNLPRTYSKKDLLNLGIAL